MSGLTCPPARTPEHARARAFLNLVRLELRDVPERYTGFLEILSTLSTGGAPSASAVYDEAEMLLLGFPDLVWRFREFAPPPVICGVRPTFGLPHAVAKGKGAAI